MPAFTEADHTLKRQDVSKTFNHLEPADTPFFTMLPKGGTAEAAMIEYALESIRVSGHKGVAGSDVTTFQKNTREYLKARLQMVEEPWMVTTKANRRPAPEMNGKESARQKYHCLLTLKKVIERRLLSNEDCLEEGGGNQDETRGALRWADTAEQTTYPVPAAYRPTSAMRYTGALASFSETSLENMLKAIRGVRKAKLELDYFVGEDLQAQIDGFLLQTADVASHTIIRSINFDGKEREVARGVGFVKTSFGSARVHLTDYLATDATTGADTAYTPKSGLLVKLSEWEVRFAIDGRPATFDLPDLGGGPRGFARAELALICKNPQATGSNYSNS